MARPPRQKAPAGYAVGRGRPPSHTRFKPGQSGNPGGRKKGSRNLKAVLDEVLNEEIVLTENGRKRTVPILEALIKRALQEALKGDMRALKDLLDRYERHVGSEPEIEEELPEHDQALLRRMFGLRDKVESRLARASLQAEDEERAMAEVGDE